MLTPADYRPTVDEVALLLRTRTVGGQQQGGLGSDTGPADVTTWDGTTRPTDVEADDVITTAMGAVNGRIPIPQIPDWQADAVKYAVQLQAAILIEVSFFRETANEALINLWNGWLDTTLTGITDAVEGSPTHFSFGNLTVGTVPPPLPAYLNSDPHEWIDGYAVELP